MWGVRAANGGSVRGCAVEGGLSLLRPWLLALGIMTKATFHMVLQRLLWQEGSQARKCATAGTEIISQSITPAMLESPAFLANQQRAGWREC